MNAITRGKTVENKKPTTDHKITKTAPILNKNKGANKKNNPKAKIPFIAPIQKIYCR